MEISEELFQKYNISIPRYTSYPPATAFHTGVSGEDFTQQLQLSNSSQPENVSIYIHIPFCTQRCHFCGCNTAIHQGDEKINAYIQSLKKEIVHLSSFIDKKRLVTQVSWGGGTPNSIDWKYVREIMDLLRSIFQFADFAEIAMECNPAYLDYADMNTLADIGFNRVSLGIQDFHPEVLDAINRKAPRMNVADMLDYMRDKGFRGLNIDLVYGLPLQTIDSFRENIARAIELQPDRIATFSYAHVPWVNPEQKRLEKYNMPAPDEKLKMLVASINEFSANGYDLIGMDHFAKMDDELSIAKRNMQLHRNFQGYSTKKTTGQVYGFGASAISQLDGCYAQNIKSTDQYIRAIETHGTATERGYILSNDERIIRDTINTIMCNGFIDFEQMANSHQITANELIRITQFDPSKITDLVQDKLVELSDQSLRVRPTGMLVVRNIAATFDPNLEQGMHKYSKTL